MQENDDQIRARHFNGLGHAAAVDLKHVDLSDLTSL